MTLDGRHVHCTVLLYTLYNNIYMYIEHFLYSEDVVIKVDDHIIYFVRRYSSISELAVLVGIFFFHWVLTSHRQPWSCGDFLAFTMEKDLKSSSW